MPKGNLYTKARLSRCCKKVVYNKLLYVHFKIFHIVEIMIKV